MKPDFRIRVLAGMILAAVGIGATLESAQLGEARTRSLLLGCAADLWLPDSGWASRLTAALLLASFVLVLVTPKWAFVRVALVGAVIWLLQLLAQVIVWVTG